MPFVHSGTMTGIIQRALNYVDHRLMDHGKRVSFVVSKMLECEGCYDARTRDRVCMLALLHDVGAFRTEEIDRLVQFETEGVWCHSVYGYLFLRELSPLADLAEVVLYHHADVSTLGERHPAVRHLAQMLHLADRADIFISQLGRTQDELAEYLQTVRGEKFSGEIIDLFLQTQQRFRLCEALAECRLDEAASLRVLDQGEVMSYLRMLVYVIDFRSHYTVTHTITTTEASRQIALRLGLDGAALTRVFYGAMFHDLGKIGIPVEVLEKPGCLTDREMEVMRGHVEITAHILSDSVDEKIARIALRHHEKLDGSGYPEGLTGNRLTLEERIVAVADIVSALQGKRSYKEPFSRKKTLAILAEERDAGKLDPDVVSVLEGELDEIMAEVTRVCDPILDVYRQIQEEYVALTQQPQ